MRNQQIYEEACEWFVRMRDGDDAPGSRAELMEWLRRSPEHVQAYLDIAAVWMEAKHTEVDSDTDFAERIALAKSDKTVGELAPRTARPALRILGSRGWFALVASVVILTAGLATTWWQLGRSTYSTGVGEQRSIALRDGSTVELNSQSRVRIHLDDKERSIELLQGQALFLVAKDAARPFIVHADNTAVRAVGTVFDVYRKTQGTVVTVVEGRVSVRPGPEPRADRGQPVDADKPSRDRDSVTAMQQHKPAGQHKGELMLDAGEQLVVGPNPQEEPKSVNVSAATAWTRRELVFEFTPLAEAAAEFNRYNERQLIVEGEQMRAFKISAVFRSTDSGSLVRYLQKMPDVRIEESEDTVRIRSDSRN